MEIDKQFIMKVLLGLALGILVACFFVLGAYTSCEKGNGTLSGFKCIDVKVIAVCEDIKGNYYDISDIEPSFLYNATYI